MSITGRPITVSISLLLVYQVQGQSKEWERANYDLKLTVVAFSKLGFILTISRRKMKEKSNVWPGSENSKMILSMRMPAMMMDNVACSGSESSLIDCPRSSYVTCNYRVAGVRCQG